MRILFVSTWHPYPPSNGSKLRVYYLLQALAARHEVTALAFSPPLTDGEHSRPARSDEQPVQAVLDDPFRLAKVREWERYVSVTPPVYRASSVMQEAIRSLAPHGPWDAAVAVQMYAARYALQADARLRIIDVDTALTYQMYERFRAEQRRGARVRAWISMQKARHYEASILRKYQAATVVWQAEAELLQGMVKSHGCTVSVIPNGVDCNYNQPYLEKPDDNALVFNGSLTYSANYDTMRWFLAEIYPKIRAKIPSVTLTITGSTQGVDLSQLCLDESVQLTGFVQDIRRPVARAIVCVTPIRQGSGTRLKILEAMALGVPVVSTTKGVEGIDVVHDEHLLLADDPDSFAQCVIALLREPELRSRLAANARSLVEKHYDWRSIGDRFLDLVDSIANVKTT